MDFATGDVLYAQDATQHWFPASTTKLMTVYVALAAVRDHKIAFDTPLVVSARAHKMPPAHMGFPTGTQVTLGNALKMLMVESPNDIAITIAEGVAGSVEAFAGDMNRDAAALGMHDSHFVNPNGLAAPDHYSSARDLAILARALLTTFPDEAKLFDIGELQLGQKRIQNTNSLLGRYPGMDGMKTGYTCAAGWNLVATAFRGGRRLVVVVLGAPTAELRNGMVVDLLDPRLRRYRPAARLDPRDADLGGRAARSARPGLRERRTGDCRFRGAGGTARRAAGTGKRACAAHEHRQRARRARHAASHLAWSPASPRSRRRSSRRCKSASAPTPATRVSWRSRARRTRRSARRRSR